MGLVPGIALLYAGAIIYAATSASGDRPVARTLCCGGALFAIPVSVAFLTWGEAGFDSLGMPLILWATLVLAATALSLITPGKAGHLLELLGLLGTALVAVLVVGTFLEWYFAVAFGFREEVTVNAVKQALASLGGLGMPAWMVAYGGRLLHRESAPREGASRGTNETQGGMSAYAKDGTVVCFFQSAQKFKTRYATFGFSDEANLNEGAMWPTAFALTELTAAEEAKVAVPAGVSSSFGRNPEAPAGTGAEGVEHRT